MLKPRRPCTMPSCPALAEPGHSRCTLHKRKEKQENDRSRGTSKERGYDSVWHRVRNLKADCSPLCQSCLSCGIERPLDVVHHIKSIEYYPELRLVMENLMSLCTPCHEKIHGKERWKTKPSTGTPIYD